MSPTRIVLPFPNLLSAAVLGALGAALLPAPLSAQERTSQPAVKLTAPAPRQPKSQQVLIELRTEKLAKPVFEKVAWRTDFDAAKKEAKATGKLLLTYFTRSYAH